MKILFNTYSPNKPSSAFYISGFERFKDISFFDYDNYEDFDLVLFMGYIEDLKEIERAKDKNPNILIGIVDPKSKESINSYTKLIDFFIVDSIEMSDFWQDFRKPIFTYFEYPFFNSKKKTHIDKDRLIIAYHGNKVHLTSFFPNISKALEILGSKYNITLKAIYNISELGKWTIGRPKNIEIEDIQWSPEVYEHELALADIGIIPSLIPLKDNSKKRTNLSKFFLATDDDYLIRFKMLSNPGRLIVFSKLGIPVVAEMSPSHLEFIKNGFNGYIAYSTGAWVNGIEKLIISSDVRNKISEEMFKTYLNNFDYDVQNKKLRIFFEKLLSKDLDTFDLSYDLNFENSNLEKFKFRNAYSFDKLKKIYNRVFKN